MPIPIFDDRSSINLLSEGQSVWLDCNGRICNKKISSFSDQDMQLFIRRCGERSYLFVSQLDMECRKNQLLFHRSFAILLTFEKYQLKPPNMVELLRATALNFSMPTSKLPNSFGGAYFHGVSYRCRYKVEGRRLGAKI